MPTKTIEQVQLADTITGNDKLLVVKTDCNNKTRSVTVENFIHDNSINTGEINNCAIIEPKIADGAIVNRHICANTIDGNIVTAGTLDANKICSNSITSDRICTDGITADCITSGTLDASQVTVCNINASNITSGTLDASQVTVCNINASNITSGNICGDLITGLTISADCIEGLSVTADDITTGTLDANQVTVCNIDANNISTGTLDANRISANSIDACKLCACSITADQIDACAITSDKIAAGAIASSTQIVCGVIAGCHLVSDSVITNTIQSTNFDGQLVNGEYTIGTEGYSLNASTGTLVLNSLVARNNIIAGNYICYNEEGGFAVDSCGNFKIAVDNDTLTVADGGLTIKTIPDTAVVTQTSDVNWTGGHDTVDLGVYPTNGSNKFQYGGITGDPIRDTGNGVPPLHVVPLTQAVGGPLVSMINLTDIDLYNLTIMVDYSNVGNLATADFLNIDYNMFFSDDDYTRTNSGAFGSKTFTQVSNPVLPLGVVEYTIPSNDINFLNAQTSTNRWGIGFVSFTMRSSNNSFTGSVSISAKSSANSKLILGASGEVDSPNRTFSDILSGAY